MKIFMKLLVKLNKKPLPWLLTGGFIVLLVCAVSYLSAGVHVIPECKSIIRLNNPVNGQVRESSIIINLVRSGNHEATFYLHGHLIDKNEKNVLSRMLVTDYKYDNGYYYFTVKKVIKQPIDVINDRVIDSQVFLITSKYFFMKINEVFDGGYLFSGVRAPMFICSKD